MQCFRGRVSIIEGWERDEQNKEIRSREREEGGKKWMRKGRQSAFPLLPHPAHRWLGPRREQRLIGSFGLEKWISSPQKTCFLPNQMTNELLICCLQSGGAQCPLSAHDGPHNGLWGLPLPPAKKLTALQAVAHPIQYDRQARCYVKLCSNSTHKKKHLWHWYWSPLFFFFLFSETK